MNQPKKIIAVLTNKKRKCKWLDGGQKQYQLEQAIQEYRQGTKLSHASKMYSVPSRTLKRYCDEAHETSLVERLKQQDEIIDALKKKVERLEKKISSIYSLSLNNVSEWVLDPSLLK